MSLIFLSTFFSTNLLKPWLFSLNFNFTLNFDNWFFFLGEWRLKSGNLYFLSCFHIVRCYSNLIHLFHFNSFIKSNHLLVYGVHIFITFKKVRINTVDTYYQKFVNRLYFCIIFDFELHEKVKFPWFLSKKTQNSVCSTLSWSPTQIHLI